MSNWLSQSSKLNEANLLSHLLSLVLSLPIDGDHLENFPQIKDVVASLTLKKLNLKEEIRFMADQLLNQWYRRQNQQEIQMTYDEEGRFQEEYREF